ncbi:MAG: saccharopine dehydrogenase C-terminal domain-containing protein [Bacteroidota bacterium]|jgi:saccharopine dehydrogenase-like NADP-dependent oxidoreductase|nr:saccharopine dehydrogenase C-terminal domain-containing protein [Bacteroidota bacterium]
MKKVLVLGAGLVARPLVRYLLNEPECQVTVATRTVSKAEKLIEHHPRGVAMPIDVQDDAALRAAIAPADIVISLVPWMYHMNVATLCVELGKNMVTTSYVKPPMQALDEAVREKGLIFLNEIGVDPGIDHMAAMSVINRVKAEGGRISSFYSYCGGLPAHRDNNNPLGYKFSWSPVGVMLAAKNNGRYLRDGETISIAPEQLFEHYWLLDVPGGGTFEAYVNRDALPYLEVYGITDATSMYRGTLRNIGHCESWNYFKQLGLLDQERRFDFSVTSPRQVMAALVDSNGDNLVADVARFLDVPKHSVTIKKLEWLGLLADEKLPIGEASVFDMFAFILEHRLVYGEHEVDLLVQHHEFIAEYPDGRRKKLTSTMVDTGIPDGDSSMARTVSLPAAIATKLILNGEINLTGVRIPVLPEIYEPVLRELGTMDIRLIEREQNL